MSFQLGHGDAIPDVLPSEHERNEDFLKAAHHVLMEVQCCYISAVLYVND